MTIAITQQNLEVDGVGSIVITSTAQDDDGSYVRDIRIFAPTEGGTAGALLVQVRVKSLLSDSIDITAPIQLF